MHERTHSGRLSCPCWAPAVTGVRRVRVLRRRRWRRKTGLSPPQVCVWSIIPFRLLHTEPWAPRFLSVRWPGKAPDCTRMPTREIWRLRRNRVTTSPRCSWRTSSRSSLCGSIVPCLLCRPRLTTTCDRSSYRVQPLRWRWIDRDTPTWTSNCAATRPCHGRRAR